MNTPSSAVANALQMYQVNLIQKPLERVALGTPVVVVTGGIEAVIAGHSTCDCNRYEIVWFDRHFWRVCRKWVNRSCFEVVANKTAIAA